MKCMRIFGHHCPKSAMMLKYGLLCCRRVSVPKQLIDRMNKAKAAAGDDKKKARAQEQPSHPGDHYRTYQVLEPRVHIQAIEWRAL